MGPARSKRRPSQAVTLDPETDLLPEDASVWGWGYRTDELRNHAAGARTTYEVEPRRALLLALAELASAKSKVLRESDFLVWTGEYSQQYWLAFPREIPDQLFRFLDDRLECVVGYDCVEYGYVSAMGLVPKYRYESGAVIEYDPEPRGEPYADEYYRTRVILRGRRAVHESELRGFREWANEPPDGEDRT